MLAHSKNEDSEKQRQRWAALYAALDRFRVDSFVGKFTVQTGINGSLVSLKVERDCRTDDELADLLE